MELMLSELLNVLQQMEDEGLLDTQEPHKTKLELWRLQDGTLGIAVYRRKEAADMATKNNNRNIRISDHMLQLIERQRGNNFTEKWENLVIRCNWELPEKEKQLKALDDQISQKRKQLQEMNKELYTLQEVCRDLIPRAEGLQRAFERNLQKYEA